MPDLRQKHARVREKDYLGFVAKLYCLPCLAAHGILHRGVEVCHIRMSIASAGWLNPGVQQKPDDRKTFPACPKMHRLGRESQHHRGDEAAWWDWLGVDPVAFTEALGSAFDADSDGNKVVVTFAARARRAKAALADTEGGPLDHEPVGAGHGPKRR